MSDRVCDDEVELINGAGDHTRSDRAGYRLSVFAGKAVAAIDALARKTRLETADVELLADRHNGRRGIRRARAVLDLVDPGAESPQETWPRLVVIRNGFPRPQTQIPLYGEFGVLVAVFDLGWEDMKSRWITRASIIGSLAECSITTSAKRDGRATGVDGHPHHSGGRRGRNRGPANEGVATPNVKRLRDFTRILAVDARSAL